MGGGVIAPRRLGWGDQGGGLAGGGGGVGGGGDSARDGRGRPRGMGVETRGWQGGGGGRYGGDLSGEVRLCGVSGGLGG